MSHMQKITSKKMNDQETYDISSLKKQSGFATVCRRLFKNKSAMIGISLVLLLAFLSILAPVLTPYKYNQIDMLNKFQGPSAEHWFGTDDMGRDMLTRILYGGRYSLSLCLLSVVLALVIGSFFGAISGYFGGTVDNIIMRLMDIFQAIPTLLLCVAVSAALGSGFGMTILALSISRAPGFCRMLRAQFMAVGKQEYVDAAHSMSVRKSRIIVRHILPNAWSPLIVQATMQVSTTLLLSSSLSFVGLGIRPPLPEWGAMLAAGRDYILYYPHMIVVPGLIIMVTVLGLNMFGDALRDALDPKLKN